MKNALRSLISIIALLLPVTAAAETLNQTTEHFSNQPFRISTAEKVTASVRQSYQSHVWFHTVDISMSGDNNRNGFYYNLYIEFDADTSRAYQAVYAEYTLLPYRGPERLLYTSSVFELVRQTSNDWFAIETDLLEDYPADYYLLTIRLYDAVTGFLLAEISGFDTLSLDDLPLEDYQRDQRHNHTRERSGGNIGIFALAGLTLLTWRRCSGRQGR
ncbi:choice-of-anchor H family protein [Chromatiaceae bacterium AAb-1]|nr:choice-of-anchor H family protein [Chromatiaceae bacterium AAb-1]